VIEYWYLQVDPEAVWRKPVRTMELWEMYSSRRYLDQMVPAESPHDARLNVVFLP